MRIIDMADDLGASFKAFIDEVGADSLSDTVKTASWLEPGKAKDRDYALILVDDDGSSHRKYACHDPGATLVSMFYLERAQSVLNPAATKVAAANLARLAQDWGLAVPAEIEKMAAAALPAGAEKDVIDERRVYFHPPKQASAPRTPSAWDKVASLQQDWAEMSPQDRRRASVEMLKIASTTPITVPARCYQYAGDGLSEKFASRMRARVELTTEPEIRSEYENLAKVASLFPPDNVVAALYALDEAAHLRWAGGDRYGETIPDPVRCVYERAKEAAFMWTQGGDHVTEHDLVMFRAREAARTYFTSTFTDALWEKFEKDPVGTFKAMPDYEKVLLSRLAREE